MKCKKKLLNYKDKNSYAFVEPKELARLFCGLQVANSRVLRLFGIVNSSPLINSYYFYFNMKINRNDGNNKKGTLITNGTNE